MEFFPSFSYWFTATFSVNFSSILSRVHKPDKDEPDFLLNKYNLLDTNKPRLNSSGSPDV